MPISALVPAAQMTESTMFSPDPSLAGIQPGASSLTYSSPEERLLFRWGSRRLARALARTALRPNHVSMMSLLTTVAAAGAIILTAPPVGIAGRAVTAATLYLAYFLDKLDGDLARAQGLSSMRGAYLDSFLDRLGELILLLAALMVSVPPGWLVLASAAGPLLFWAHAFMFWHYMSGAASFFPTASGWKRDLKNLAGYNRTKHFLVYIILAVAGRLEYIFLLLPWLVLYTSILFLVLVVSDRRLRTGTDPTTGRRG